MANTKLPSRLLDTSAVPVLNVTGDLTVDTTTLKVDTTNNRVQKMSEKTMRRKENWFALEFFGNEFLRINLLLEFFRFVNLQ